MLRSTSCVRSGKAPRRNRTMKSWRTASSHPMRCREETTRSTRQRIAEVLSRTRRHRAVVIVAAMIARGVIKPRHLVIGRRRLSNHRRSARRCACMGGLESVRGETSMRRKILALAAAVALGTADNDDRRHGVRRRRMRGGGGFRRRRRPRRLLVAADLAAAACWWRHGFRPRWHGRHGCRPRLAGGHVVRRPFCGGTARPLSLEAMALAAGGAITMASTIRGVYCVCRKYYAQQMLRARSVQANERL